MMALASIGRMGIVWGFSGFGGVVRNPHPHLAALRSSSLLLCLYVNLRLSAALYAKIENTNTNTNGDFVRCRAAMKTGIGLDMQVCIPETARATPFRVWCPHRVLNTDHGFRRTDRTRTSLVHH